MKVKIRIFGIGLLIVLTLGCAVPEVERMETARTVEDGYRSYNELIERLSRTPMIANSNPYYKPLGRGIRADWAGNYLEAENAFRDAINNPSYWQTEYAAPHKPMWILIFHAYLANALYKQGKIDEAIKTYGVAEPSFPGLISRAQPGSADEHGWKIFAAYHCKAYAEALERSGANNQALEIYRKSFKYGANEVQANITRLERVIAERSQILQASIERGAKAEQNGQWDEALKNYTEALSLSVSISGSKNINHPLVQKTVTVARKIEPAPAIPEEARRHAVFASVAVKESKDPGGYEKAIEESLQAVCLAPWWGDLYVNTALIMEQMGRYDDACKFLNTYLMITPNAPDAQQVKTKIYELEFKAKK
jgi:tetratricopeptide (TPR) repeat protein